MSYLRILFDGIVATGPAPAPYPHEPGQPSSHHPDEVKNGPFFAVMPVVGRRLSRLAPFENNKEWYIPAHFPVMIAQKSLKSEGRDADESTDHFNLWYPLRERMEFSFDGNAVPGRLTYRNSDWYPPTGLPPGASAYHIHSTHKVSHMGEVYPERTRLKIGMLSRTAPAVVASQVFVPFGTVNGGADDDLRKDGVEDALFRPSRVEPPLKKTIVPHTVVTVPVEDKIVIRMSSLDTGETLDPIVLRISQDAEIRIGNADPENIDYVLTGVEPKRRIKPQITDEVTKVTYVIDVDFEGIYSVLGGPDDGEAMPVPWTDKRYGMRNCYGAFVNPDSGG